MYSVHHCSIDLTQAVLTWSSTALGSTPSFYNNQSINKSINQSTNQSINQLIINQSIN